MKLLIIGAGGHGKIVCDAAMAMSKWNEIAFIDDRASTIVEVLGCPIIGNMQDLWDMPLTQYTIAVAIGNNIQRLELLTKLDSIGANLLPIIHPTAWVSPHAHIAPGSVIFAKAVINADAQIGFGCIINTAAVVEHDCILNEAVHLSPNASLAGGVTIGMRSWIGVGASVIERIRIGRDAIIGAGSVIIENVLDETKIVGVPGRVIA